MRDGYGCAPLPAPRQVEQPPCGALIGEQRLYCPCVHSELQASLQPLQPPGWMACAWQQVHAGSQLTCLPVQGSDAWPHVPAASSEALLKWLRSPALPRYFVLDLLDFVLANTPAIFRCAATRRRSAQAQRAAT